jgi:yeast amino acid transporter
MSKETYNVSEVPGHDGHAHDNHVSGAERKAGALNEAGEIYGNIQTAEDYGYVTRGQVSTLVAELIPLTDAL